MTKSNAQDVAHISIDDAEADGSALYDPQRQQVLRLSTQQQEILAPWAGRPYLSDFCLCNGSGHHKTHR